MAAGKPRTAGRIWGDGFAEDGWSEAAAVRVWGECSPEEYIRLFPKLVTPGAPLPDCLRLHLTDGVAARAWAMRGCQALVDEPVTSVDATGIETRGPRAAAEWFAAKGWSSWFRANHAARRGPARSRELSALRFVDALVSDILAGRPVPFDAATSIRFAFHAGLHPLYIWPEVAATHERDTAAGWLGHLSRRRRAFMPVEVAHYLVDAIAITVDGAGFFRDPDVAPLTAELADVADLAAIGRAARARLRGARAVIHLAAAKRQQASFPSMRHRTVPGEAVVQ